jgi:hypothetical protein
MYLKTPWQAQFLLAINPGPGADVRRAARRWVKSFGCHATPGVRTPRSEARPGDTVDLRSSDTRLLRCRVCRRARAADGVDRGLARQGAAVQPANTDGRPTAGSARSPSFRLTGNWLAAPRGDVHQRDSATARAGEANRLDCRMRDERLADQFPVPVRSENTPFGHLAVAHRPLDRAPDEFRRAKVCRMRLHDDRAAGRERRSGIAARD